MERRQSRTTFSSPGQKRRKISGIGHPVEICLKISATTEITLIERKFFQNIEGRLGNQKHLEEVFEMFFKLEPTELRL